MTASARLTSTMFELVDPIGRMSFPFLSSPPRLAFRFQPGSR
jgi:hypothetical protein